MTILPSRSVSVVVVVSLPFMSMDTVSAVISPVKPVSRVRLIEFVVGVAELSEA